MGNIDQLIDSESTSELMKLYKLSFSLVLEDGSLRYSEIRTFLQKQSDVAGTYLSITTSANNIISLTGSHLIYIRKTVSEDFNPM